MIAFEVKDMTCGHCVSTITKAVKAIDHKATVSVDLGAHRVEIELADAARARDDEQEQVYDYDAFQSGVKDPFIPPGLARDQT